MAQAARLNLRMQKELKLLVTDPPPGASFPLLSPDSHFSLSNLLAHIEGPEDTVYANGIFKIKIQIPDRYPFQPPVVTFATPIYHPNIDNGGRICLDILNLPPKGAWQPSLNISTVLTSIGLLLNEPNPDDGLMCEASKEYKYNRQAFDLKARSMTEKYARVEASENGTGNQKTKSHSNRSMMETEESLFKFEVKESSEGRGKVGIFSRKLSLESSASNKKTGIEHSVAPINQVLENHIEAKTLEQHQKEMVKDNLHNGTKRKLSLYSSAANQQKDGENKENSVPEPDQRLSVLNSQNISIDSSESLPVFQDINHLDRHSHQQLRRDDDVRSLNDSTTDRRSKKTSPNPEENSLYSVDHTSDNTSVKLPLMPGPSLPESHSQASPGPSSVCMTTSLCDKQEQKDCIDKTGSGFTSIKHKKLGLAGKKPSSGHFAPSKSLEKDNKENMAPVPNMFLSDFCSTLSYDGKAGNCERNVASKKMCRISQKLPLVPLAKSNESNTDNLHLHSDGDNLKVVPVKLLPLAEDHEQLHYHDKFAGQIKEQTEGFPIPESVIVLDSEDSDEESCGTLRSKLCLTRKRLLGKQNAKKFGRWVLIIRVE